jgi:formylglycine-generating enzyme required for sulfatase activity
MKMIFLLFGLILLIVQQALSNNIQVSNVRLTGQNTTDDFTMVEFDITWENSWRYSGGPNNWDAAWVFVKYRVGEAGEWKHAWINNTGHASCANNTVTTGFLSPGLSFNATTNPGMGIFLYRSISGSGTFSCQDVQIRWNYGTNGVSDNAQVDIRVFAIEMVYTPEGNVYVGSGGTETGAFYSYPNSTTPYHITSENAIPVAMSTGSLYYNNTTGTPGDQLGPIPAEFPKGFKSFYAMKYEISQKGYVDFLNTLSRTQQINRVRSNISGTSVINVFAISNASTPINRNGICCHAAIPPQPGAVEFFCDLNANLIENEPTDGLAIACNSLLYGDVAAYIDWSGLRLTSEFEFEKCGRGSSNSNPNEFAWGNSVYYLATSLVNANTINEVPGQGVSNAGGNSLGPLRTGCFARMNSNRTLSGAGFYGCLDLTGNVSEYCVTTGNPEGRSYTGIHGNGILNANGHADEFGWPSSITSTGAGCRGGSYSFTYDPSTLSYRFWGANPNSNIGTNGGRGVRTAE